MNPPALVLALVLAQAAGPAPGQSTNPVFGAAWPTWVLADPDRAGQAWTMTVGTTRTQSCTGPIGMQITTIGNPYPFSIFLTKLDVWRGVSKTGSVDLWMRVWLSGHPLYDPAVVLHTDNWDRYAPTSEHRPVPVDFGGGYFEMEPGYWLTLAVQCTDVWMHAEKAAGLASPGTYDIGFKFVFEAVRPKR